MVTIPRVTVSRARTMSPAAASFFAGNAGRILAAMFPTAPAALTGWRDHRADERLDHALVSGKAFSSLSLARHGGTRRARGAFFLRRKRLLPRQLANLGNFPLHL